ncbi:unnamed protein product [Cladocopium goreaui]|uniref:SREBP regulating gene protein n=1 Tax=Cladocopium goreaui TaxID=2562237 RepID=A0A9P1GJS9_9DINO|nr:unnamed protein product [Cladocopium goreaui]
MTHVKKRKFSVSNPIFFHQEHLQRTIPSRYLGNTEAAALGASATLLPGHYVDVAFDAVDAWTASSAITSGALPLGGWRLCAREGGRCNCVGTVALHSLLADWTMLRHVNGSIPCGVAFFGDDPRPNLPKLCSCLHSVPWPESLVEGLNETISRSLLPRVEAGPPEATCSAEDDGRWTPCSILSSRHDGSLVPDRLLPRLPVEEQRDMALRKLDLCHRLVGPDQALRILGVWPTNIQMGVVPIKASSAPLCAVVYSPIRGAVWDSRAAIFCPTEPPKCLEVQRSHANLHHPMVKRGWYKDVIFRCQGFVMYSIINYYDSFMMFYASILPG